MNDAKAISAFEKLKSELAKGTRVVTLNGLTSPSAKAFVLAKLQAEIGKTIVILTESNRDLEMFECDLEFFRMSPESKVLALPSFDTDIYAGVSPHAETQEKRALALWELTNTTPNFLLLSARSMITRTVRPDEIRGLGVVLEREMDFAPELLTDLLVEAGYVREEPINNIGQFSVRGGIVDLWSPKDEYPVRLEFFGDTVDSIREFDPETQLSTRQVDRVSVPPMRELAASPDDFRSWAAAARKHFSDTRFSRLLKDRLDFADEGEDFAGWEFLMPLIRPLDGTVFQYLKDFVIVVDEPIAIKTALAEFYKQINAHFAAAVSTGEVALPPERLFMTPDQVYDKLAVIARIELRSLGMTAAITDEEFEIEGMSGDDGPSPVFLFSAAENPVEIDLQSRSTRKFHGDVEAFANDLKNRLDQGSEKLHIALTTSGITERFEELIREYNVDLPGDSTAIGDLSGGFELPPFGLTFFTEEDIFGEDRQKEVIAKDRSTAASRKSKLGAFISDFRDLKPGDFVVHVDHGIGRFDGLQTISSQGVDREFMLLVYAEDAKLFVPVERLDLVSRYSSGESSTVAIDRLGGIGWQKTKAKAKRAMRDMADELLKLYAERKLVRGHAFPPDAPWQHEFEDAFPFDLTVDQASAIEDVKTDMETPSPMDRLIIGDVGYGKTEVAMRAAFKAVMDGTQVAILTPTTILAYQHYESFSRRFAAFPAKVDLLSRFRSAKEQKSVVEAAGKGEVDVLIGTHRVLSNDVKLPKLGLVIVDEEQRFGVGHKEKLKHLKKKVDVLTLSATPIPRTLNMSLLGMRDMSIIETPPRDRLAINTQVVQFSESVIRSAIELELARNGQVFFIHNRVETIESIAALVQKIVPNARIAIGHGQMNEKEMEQVMLDFIDYKFDVLVATTIIENGIDIPRANTIIINRADNYGLSQLYQLRGRTGRSNRRAYAYLLIPSEIELTPIARRRLSAIREFSDLGAGFRLAALDLELRGAGNILGGQQSGQLDALGFDLYTKMLERTIAELRGDEIADEVSVSLNLGVDVSIPKEYIQDTSQRLRTYKRISSAASEEAFTQIQQEIEDRYGHLPMSVINLFDYGRLRKLAESMGLMSIDRTPNGIAIKLGENAAVSPEALMDFLGKNKDASFSPNGIVRFEAAEKLISTTREVLEKIRK